MKKFSIMILSLLLFGLFTPLSPISSHEKLVEAVDQDNTMVVASTPGVNGSVIKVLEDSAVESGNPDTNYNSSTTNGGLFGGTDITNADGRSWLKFDLRHITPNARFARATVNIYHQGDFGSEDYPLGIYYSEDDTWAENLITWNNQPEFESVAADSISTPDSPNMFAPGNWYEWEITAEVIQTLEEDGIISLLLKQVDESYTNNTAKGFSSKEYAIINEVNTIPYIALEYSTPITSDLTVDGFDESPQIDYIQSSNPEFGWTFNDADQDDFQRSFEIEVWNNTHFNDTSMMIKRNSFYHVVHDTADVGAGNTRPFGTNSEIRMQFKWPESMVDYSGTVDKLFFEVQEESASTIYYDLTIYMVCVFDTSALGSNFKSNYDGRTPTLVLNRSAYTAITENGFLTFDIENNFIVHEGMELIVEVRHSGYSGDQIHANQTTAGGSAVYEWGPGDYCSATAGYVTSRTHGMRMEMVSETIYSSGSSSNSYPFNVIGNGGRFQLKYNQSLIGEAGIVDKIIFPVTTLNDVTYENFSIYLCESPLKGELDHTDMDGNFGGVTPTLVLEADEFTIRNIGAMLVIDVEDLFYYSNTDDLLIELKFDEHLSGSASVRYQHDGGGYRAWTFLGTGNDHATYNMILDFIYDTETYEYFSCAPLVNETTYYWRMRTCDSFGIWSPWASGSFTYEVLESEPDYSGLTESDPVELGDDATVSITVTHTTEINQVLIEYEGGNNTMTQAGDVFSWTWTPASTGVISYTIYMEAYSGVWATTSGSILIEDTTSPAWDGNPEDQELAYGEALSYQLNATDLSGIDIWKVNDTSHFSIVDGLLANVTFLDAGNYPVLVTVNDTEGNSLNATITITVLQSTTTSTTSSTTTTTDTDTSDTGTTTPPPMDPTLILIFVGVGAAAVVIIIIIVIQKKKT